MRHITAVYLYSSLMSQVVTPVLWMKKLKHEEADIHVRSYLSAVVVDLAPQSLLCEENELCFLPGVTSDMVREICPSLSLSK